MQSIDAPEEWRTIPGYEGFYEASTRGRIRSLHHSRSRVLKPIAHHTGYMQVSLSRDGRKRTRRVHQLVLEAFVGPCPDGMEACHYDDDAENNALSNLRWGTSSENAQDKLRNGTHNNAIKTHCPQGHAYVPENIYRAPSRPDERVCRTCRRAHHRVLNEIRKSRRAAA